jgi:hypothetical protein
MVFVGVISLPAQSESLLITASSWPVSAVERTMVRESSEMRWQDAVATLSRERTLAETWGGALKKYGDAMAVSRGALAYGEAKAEYDAVIAGLAVALARKAQTASLKDLQTLLQRGYDKREAFCRIVELLLPATGGEKGVLVDVVRGAVKPLTDAVVAIWSRSRDEDDLMRRAVQTQLEATSWPTFDKVPPLT